MSGADDMTLTSLYPDLEVVQGTVLVPDALVRESDDLAWVRDVGGLADHLMSRLFDECGHRPTEIQVIGVLTALTAGVMVTRGSYRKPAQGRRSTRARGSVVHQAAAVLGFEAQLEVGNSHHGQNMFDGHHSHLLCSLTIPSGSVGDVLLCRAN